MSGCRSASGAEGGLGRPHRRARRILPDPFIDRGPLPDPARRILTDPAHRLLEPVFDGNPMVGAPPRSRRILGENPLGGSRSVSVAESGLTHPLTEPFRSQESQRLRPQKTCRCFPDHKNLTGCAHGKLADASLALSLSETSQRNHRICIVEVPEVAGHCNAQT